MRKIRTVIIDDEPLARQRIRTLLADQTEIDVVCECSDGAQAVEAIRRRRPDLVFLDIQMPELTGFDVFAAIGVENMPAVIFVTAYDRYALKAFDVNAVDYLLKPFDRDRFVTAIKRARETINRNNLADPRLAGLMSTLEDDRKFADRLLVRSSGRLTAVKTADVVWIEAAGNYVSVYTGGDTHLHRETMKELERQLDPARFVRVHRSVIVNIRHVKEIRARQSGDSDILLDSDHRVPLSRRFRAGFERALSRRR